MLRRTTQAALAVGIALGLAAGAAPAQQANGDAQAARGKISMCIGCHGIKGYHTAYPQVYHVPKIAGNPSGNILEILDDGAGNTVDVNALSAT